MPITAFDHVNIRTSNLKAMMHWYEDTLGLISGERPDFGFPGAWLYLGDQAIVHLIEVDTDPKAGNNLTLEHFALKATDLAAFTKHLEDRGVPYRAGKIASLGITQINILDPDGNHIHVDFAA